MNSSNMQFQQNMNATIQDLKTNLPSQIIPNSRGNTSVVTLRSGKELPQPAPQQLPRSIDADFEPDADSQVTQKPESDDELLRIFRKVEINIPLLDAIKQIPKYAKFLNELCVHKRKKMKGGVEVGGIVSVLTKNEYFTAGAQQALPKKCRDPRIFSIPCTIGDSNINLQILEFWQPGTHGDDNKLANRSVVQPLGILEDVVVQVNELIFPADFYVLDMEDEPSGMDPP
ncbi:hypothetical protein CR513_07134, partial [Mucuna pruriens]